MVSSQPVCVARQVNSIVLEDVLIVFHLEIVNAIGSISSGIEGSKLTAKEFNKLFPIVFPSQWFVRH